MKMTTDCANAYFPKVGNGPRCEVVCHGGMICNSRRVEQCNAQGCEHYRVPTGDGREYPRK